MGAQGFRLVSRPSLCRSAICRSGRPVHGRRDSSSRQWVGNLLPLELPNGPFKGQALAAPSFNGRTADSGSAYRGSNPWGAANHASRVAYLESSRPFYCGQIRQIALGVHPTSFLRDSPERSTPFLPYEVVCCPTGPVLPSGASGWSTDPLVILGVL